MKHVLLHQTSQANACRCSTQVNNLPGWIPHHDHTCTYFQPLLYNLCFEPMLPWIRVRMLPKSRHGWIKETTHLTELARHWIEVHPGYVIKALLQIYLGHGWLAAPAAIFGHTPGVVTIQSSTTVVIKLVRRAVAGAGVRRVFAIRRYVFYSL